MSIYIVTSVTIQNDPNILIFMFSDSRQEGKKF
jgi:hypothetical protein